MATTLTGEGQVTMPKAVRDALGVGPGQAVEVTLQPDDKVVVTKAGGEATASLPPLTRDAARHRIDFPTVRLICP